MPIPYTNFVPFLQHHYKMTPARALQIVMVSLGTHLVKEPMSLNLEKYLKKYLGLYETRQLIWRQAPGQTCVLQFTEQK